MNPFFWQRNFNTFGSEFGPLRVFGKQVFKLIFSSVRHNWMIQMILEEPWVEWETEREREREREGGEWKKEAWRTFFFWQASYVFRFRPSFLSCKLVRDCLTLPMKIRIRFGGLFMADNLSGTPLSFHFDTLETPFQKWNRCPFGHQAMRLATKRHLDRLSVTHATNYDDLLVFELVQKVICFLSWCIYREESLTFTLQFSML